MTGIFHVSNEGANEIFVLCVCPALINNLHWSNPHRPCLSSGLSADDVVRKGETEWTQMAGKYTLFQQGPVTFGYDIFTWAISSSGLRREEMI